MRCGRREQVIHASPLLGVAAFDRLHRQSEQIPENVKRTLSRGQPLLSVL